jgi:predicted transcriptional regulator
MSVAIGVEVSPDIAEPLVELAERTRIVPWQAADQACLTSFADERWAADEKHRRTDGGQRQSLTNW